MKDESREELDKRLKEGKFNRLIALMTKEFFQIIRDPSSLLISVFLPLLLIFIYGSGVSLDIRQLKLGVAMEDSAPDARSLTNAFIESPYFDVTVARDHRELTEGLVAGKYRGIFVIPSYFTKYRNRPDKIAPIQVIADGSETNTAQFVLNYASQALLNWVEQEGWDKGIFKETPKISVDTRFWYNETLKSHYFLLSGSLAIIMTLIGSLLTALVVAREWERGTMETMMATPVGIKELVISKVIPYYFLGMFSMLFCLLLTVYGYKVPFRGSIFVLIIVSSVFLLAMLSFGLMISTLTKSQLFSCQITLLTAFLPAYILSGFLFEIYSMPRWIQIVSYLVPAKYFVQSLQTLFMVGNVWSLIVYDMVCIAIFGAVCVSITYFKTAKRLD